MIQKSELRIAARLRRAALFAGQADHARLIAGLADGLAVPAAAAVASYWPVRDEADPRPLAAALAARGHPILLPRVAGPDQPLQFRLWRDGDPLRRSAAGICEPLADAPEQAPEAVLVPLLGFDSAGFRLGYGGGYYDRSLAALRARGPVVAIGIAFAGQEVEALPREPHDEALDAVVTERGVRFFSHETP
jgi:5-formyltetrahydrofolate cyclo-ligase